MVVDCYSDAGGKYLDYIGSEVRPVLKVDGVDGFEKCWYGMTEGIFVIELVWLQFCVSNKTDIGFVLKCCYWCDGSIYVDFNAVVE